MKKARLKDVAEMAGVSIATASMVLNTKYDNSGRVSAETRQRIQKIAEEMNFHPAIYAQQMKGIRSGTIGLIIPDLMNHFYPEVASGFSNTAYEEGYNVMLLNSCNDIDREVSFCGTLLDMRVDGVAICGTNLATQRDKNKEKKIIKRFKSMNIPVVRLDRYDDDPICPYVGIDNYKAAYDMTVLLIKNGHRKIIGVNEDKSVYILEERTKGYTQAMLDNGLTPDLIRLDTSDEAIFKKKMMQELKDSNRATAVFSLVGDFAAIQIIQVENELGHTVPGNVSVAGIDDISLAAAINPSLTTVQQHKYEIGRESLYVLDAMIKSNSLEHGNTIIPTKCVVRNSTRNIKII